MKKIFLLVLVAFSFSNCEKDDICDANTVTTPKVVIDFYNKDNPTATKSVTNLAVGEVGNTTGYALFNGVSKIKIPLKTLEDITNYSFILNYSTTPTAFTNEDKLEFDYTRNNVFVSRACGFKTLFTINTGFPVLTDSTTADGLWIQNIVVSTVNINDENETHIKIYF